MDIFSSLTKGAHFNKTKYSSSIDLFKNTSSPSMHSITAENKKLKFSAIPNAGYRDFSPRIVYFYFLVLEKEANETYADIVERKTSSRIISAYQYEGRNTGDYNGKSNEKESSVLERIAEGSLDPSCTFEEVNAFRNKLQIKVKGTSVPNPCATFNTMNISKGMKPIILENTEKSAWKEPTAIQMQVIPCMLMGRDVLATAPTGSGKTAAFAIPILSILGEAPVDTTNKQKGTRALVLAPTRELAEQIFREISRLSTGRRVQIRLLKKSNAVEKQSKNSFSNCDVLVATPLRLLSVLRSGLIDLSRVRMVVLDEADRLFDLQTGSTEHGQEEDEEEDEVEGTKEQDPDTEEEGSKKIISSRRIRSSFLSQVDEILSHCASGKDVQRALFSATISPLVRELADGFFLRDPVCVSVGAENAGASTIDQRLVFVGREDGKLLAIRQLIQEGLKPPVLLFVQSIDRAKQLFVELVYDGINVDVMHAERSQLQREEIIRRFRTGDIWVLICTDLMARGIDFKGVQMVINYDLPQSAVSYIHRIGRTGRAGRKGNAVTFFTEKDIPLMRPIANVVKLSGCEVPNWMLTIKPLSTREKRTLRRAVPLRRRIDTGFVEKNHSSCDDGTETAAKAPTKKRKRN